MRFYVMYVDLCASRDMSQGANKHLSFYFPLSWRGIGRVERVVAKKRVRNKSRRTRVSLLGTRGR